MSTSSGQSSPAWELAEAKMARAAKKLLVNRIKRGARSYQRAIHLPHLHIDPALPTLEIIALLQNHLRAAKNSVRQGHWTGDGNRVIAIRQALRAEQGYLKGRA